MKAGLLADVLGFSCSDLPSLASALPVPLSEKNLYSKMLLCLSFSSRLSTVAGMIMMMVVVMAMVMMLMEVMMVVAIVTMVMMVKRRMVTRP